MVSKAETLWQRIFAKGANERPDFREALGLQQGASEEEFRDVETGLGFSLSEEMKDLYRVHNGQVREIGTECFVRNLTLSPLAEVLENWRFLQEEFEPDEMEPEADAEIKPMAWNPKWIPIASNGGGDYLCLDMDPSERGQAGQVLYFWHDWGRRAVEASGLFAFLELCLEEEERL